MMAFLHVAIVMISGTGPYYPVQPNIEVSETAGALGFLVKRRAQIRRKRRGAQNCLTFPQRLYQALA